MYSSADVDFFTAFYLSEVAHYTITQLPPLIIIDIIQTLLNRGTNLILCTGTADMYTLLVSVCYLGS